ncbi:STAS domain-containing protein [Pseudonocardia kujensis]|uniref:STAS domain-containing protein n=1 Tax=Pseudonocardia kujensis TaxID=1128675 RepID=UPI001E4B64B8|nr:STAS domain-containing protein [Pseudonocardia kujensis]MCE0763861.1 STAS domain-containing protein [Pseudonocardia kujensis]
MVEIELEDRPHLGYLVAHLSGEVDLASLGCFRSALHRLAEADRAVVVVELDGLQHLCAGGVRELLRLREDLEVRGGGLHLVCDENRPARMILRALGIPAGAAVPGPPAPLCAGSRARPPT